MKKTGKIPAVVTIAVLIAGAAAAALGFLALRLAKHEQNMRRTEIKDAVSAQAELLANKCRLVLEKHKREALDSLASTTPDRGGLSDLRYSSPFISEAFVADRNGALMLPLDDQTFNRRFYGLFFEAVSGTHRDAKDDIVAEPTRQRSRSKVRMNLLSKSKGYKQDVRLNSPSLIQKSNDSVVYAKPVAAKPRQINGSGRMISRFGRLSSGKRSGWIPWFSDNDLRPVAWAVSHKNDSRIIGAEIETIALLGRMQSLMPESLPDKWRLELVNASNQVINFAGWSQELDVSNVEKAVCIATYPVWSEDFPGWRIRACLAPDWSSATIFTVTAATQVLSLLLILITAGLVMFYLMRRELELAGQKTSFVANVSHELKTPLTSIRMYAEMLSERRQRLTEVKVERYLAIILSESERLSRLITNVLDFSRTEAGRKKYRPETFLLNEAIHEVMAVWSGEAEAAGVDLTVEQPAEDVWIYMDRDSLFQVIHNLLSNALKYAASGGEIGLVCHSDSSDRIIIEVRDRGPGIPSGAAKRIFKKFYRCDDSLTSETSGSGLGLSIALKLMRDQGGNLIYQPRNDGGSVFRITLPVVKEKK